MARLDHQRLEVAAAVQAELAEERTLSAMQARSFVRCLQTVWDVEQIRWDSKESASQLADARRLVHAANIFTNVEGPASPRAQVCYRRAGELLEWLSRADDPIQTIVPTTLLSACAYQLGGLPAMATGLLNQSEPTDPGPELYARFLQADFDGVIKSVARFWRRNPELTVRGASANLLRAEDGFDFAWFVTIELIRTLGLIADSMRRGDSTRMAVAFEKFNTLDGLALRSFESDDASLLVSLMHAVSVSFRDASIYLPLSQLGDAYPNKADKLKSIGRTQFNQGRGILWTSQRQGLERLIHNSSFALCTPTGSGKTLVANLALVKELLLPDIENVAPLALYLVPSRALAGEVEAKLSKELRGNLLVTGLYGGTDWGITDAWLTSETPTVLIATVEKADALFRYLRPFLLPRLRLLIVDEAHQVVPTDSQFTLEAFAGHSERSIRLEAFVSRLLSLAPNMARIALTAVAGGAAEPVARWIEGEADAQPIGVNYRSTRQLVGILRTTPERPARMQLDLMNGRPLRVRERGAGVYINLRTVPMPQLPAKMRNSLNRYNQIEILWTALHLSNEDRRILISIAQQPERTMCWYAEALQLEGWEEISMFDFPTVPSDRVLYDEALQACEDYCGPNSYELTLLRHGIATSHGQMPQRLRRLMTELIDRGLCPITVATATLTEGVNLPFDLIFVPQLKRRSFDRETQRNVEELMPVSEFRNLSGRAGRPGAANALEGITLVAIPSEPSATASGVIPVQLRQIIALRNDYAGIRQSLLADRADEEPVESPLALLITSLAHQAQRLLGLDIDAFLQWLEHTLPPDISPEAGRGADTVQARLADSLDELDAILLAAVEESLQLGATAPNPATAEEFLTGLWQRTFSAVAAAQEEWLESAFVQRGKAIVETLYSDQEERRRLYNNGMAPYLGRRFEAAIDPIKAILTNAVDYGLMEGEQRFAVFQEIGLLLEHDRGYGFRSRGTESDNQLLKTWADVLKWWLDMPNAQGPEPSQLRSWQRFVSDNLDFRVGQALGAVVARAWSEGAEDPFAVPSLDTWRTTTKLPWFAFWARELLRWGTLDPFVAFTLAQGIEPTRERATLRRQEFNNWLQTLDEDPQAEDFIDPQLFLAWSRELPRQEKAADDTKEFSAELTGTKAKKDTYAVVPVASRRKGNLLWLDPAGFELARSPLPESLRGITHRSDYVLDTVNGARVRRVFDGRRRF